MAASPPKRVLVVDDDPQVLATLASMLESIGFQVVTVDGANAALALIESERPDAILTDIHMTEGDGIELINAVREQHLNIPIVAMSGGSSGLASSDHLEVARKLGAAAVIDKPFRASHIAEAIDRAIAGRGAPPR